MSATGSITTALDDLQWLRRLAVTLARDADEAEDLVQDTLVTAWREPPRDLMRPVRPWLSTVLRNLWRMQRRAGARREQREQSAVLASGAAAEPERELARLEVLRALVAALDRLAPDDRKIIVRRYFEGESAAEIARALAIPCATVRSRIHRSLKTLRAALDEQFDARSTWSAVIVAGPPSFPTSPTKGDDMSILLKVILGASMGAAGVAGWLGLAAQPESASVASIAPAPAAPAPNDAKAVWEQRRRAIRQVLPPTLTAAPADDSEREQREHDDFRGLVHACLEDLESDASGALTLDVTKIGAPDIGTIYASIEVVETTFADAEALRCVIESMYAWVGEAPAESFERSYSGTLMLGTPTEDVKHRRIFEYVVGAHISEVRFCEKRGDPDAPDVRGHLRLTFDLEADGRGYAKARSSSAQDTDLPPEVVDCIITASRRWMFPATHIDRVFTYEFVLPVPGRGPR